MNEIKPTTSTEKKPWYKSLTIWGNNAVTVSLVLLMTEIIPILTKIWEQHLETGNINYKLLIPVTTSVLVSGLVASYIGRIRKGDLTT